MPKRCTQAVDMDHPGLFGSTVCMMLSPPILLCIAKACVLSQLRTLFHIVELCTLSSLSTDALAAISELLTIFCVDFMVCRVLRRSNWLSILVKFCGLTLLVSKAQHAITGNDIVIICFSVSLTGMQQTTMATDILIAWCCSICNVCSASLPASCGWTGWNRSEVVVDGCEAADLVLHDGVTNAEHDNFVIRTTEAATDEQQTDGGLLCLSPCGTDASADDSNYGVSVRQLKSLLDASVDEPEAYFLSDGSSCMTETSVDDADFALSELLNLSEGDACGEEQQEAVFVEHAFVDAFIAKWAGGVDESAQHDEDSVSFVEHAYVEARIAKGESMPVGLQIEHLKTLSIPASFDDCWDYGWANPSQQFSSSTSFGSSKGRSSGRLSSSTSLESSKGRSSNSSSSLSDDDYNDDDTISHHSFKLSTCMPEK